MRPRRRALEIGVEQKQRARTPVLVDRGLDAGQALARPDRALTKASVNVILP